ncbi:hypothetical protein UA32_12425 [Photobacterium angustum]|uniref:Uncharacterized protein n=1 Tax=Photobacterium angustum TaxID=661 RepID=A0ABX5H0Z9_PHOAN|nr:hypothetical protein UA32_12425 [Photobacterium angustum]PSX07019.1 hypothetical protein C0W27_15740 [Photobacterium angustum]
MNRNIEEELLKRRNMNKWLVSIPLLYIFACFTSLITYAGIKSVLLLSGLQVISDNFMLTICVVVAFVVTTIILYLIKPRYT